MLPIHAVIIDKKYATYHELLNVYYYEDIMDMLELILIDNYNSYVMNEVSELESKI